MKEQGEQFRYVLQSARQVEKDRVGDNGPGDILSIGASDDEKAAAKFDSDTRFNVELYEPYWQATQPRQTTLAPTYPAAHDPNVSAGPITADPIDPGTGGKTHTSGFTGGTSGHQGSSGGYTGGPSTYTAPPGAGNYVAPPISRPPVAPPRAPMVPPPGVRRPNDGTDLSWAKDRPGPNPPGGFMPPGSFGPGGDTSGGGGGFGPGGGGGFGPGAGGFGPGGGGAGSGSAPGAGNATGARAPGMSAAEGMGRGGPMGGAAGKPGAGMGGMGSGAGKGGKGGEDEEHQRKILLPEEDPDSIFGGYDGDKPTPPVIGA